VERALTTPLRGNDAFDDAHNIEGNVPMTRSFDLFLRWGTTTSSEAIMARAIQ
jgi:hypothetical protein